MNTFIHYPLLLGALACLGACSVGPQYRAPEIAPIQLASPQAEDFAQGAAQPLAAWWTFFDDAQLARLIESAVAHNHDVRQARANLLLARAYVD